MEKLLENQDRRKLAIIFNLSLDFDTKSINELAEELETNTRTLLTSIDEINQDAKHYQQKARIERISKSEVIFGGEVGFSIFEFKFKYIQDSVLYQILDASFKNSYTNLQEAADAFHISYTSLYRKLTSLKKILKGFDLDFESQSHFPIRGSEKQIRFFFFHFYWYTYKHSKWPFNQELKELCTLIYTEIFEAQFSFKSHVVKEKIILLLAINILRNESGFILKEDDVIDMLQILRNSSDFAWLQEKISQTPHDLGNTTYSFIYLMMMCDEDYVDEANFNFVSFLGIIGEKRAPYEETTLVVLQSLSRLINRPLMNSEFSEIYQKLLKVNMRAYFFTERDEFFTPDRRLDYSEKHYAHYEPYIKAFYQELIKRGKHFRLLKEAPYLYRRYQSIFLAHLEIQTLHPQINIAFMLGTSPLATLYQNKIKSFIISPIQFTSEVTTETDLVITSTPFGLEPETNYFILTVPATPWEWGLLEMELTTIEQSKMGLANGKTL